MVNKYIKRYATSLVIRKFKLNHSGYQETTTRMAKLKRLGVGKNVEELELLCITGESVKQYN